MKIFKTSRRKFLGLVSAASAAALTISKKAKAQFNTGAFWKGSGGPVYTGQLWFFGDIQHGDDAVSESTLAPLLVSSGPWASVSREISGSHTLGLKTDGTLWGWESNWAYALTNSHPTSVFSSPVQIPGSWSQIAAGGTHSLGIKPDGTLWAWGRTQYGEIPGNATLDYVVSPVQIAGSWSQITACDAASFGIMTDGTLWGCGGNGSGVLGQNDSTNRSALVQIAGSWSQIAAGGVAGEAALYAIKTDGTLWLTGLWGAAYYSSPVQVHAGSTYNQVTHYHSGYTITRLMGIRTDNSLWGEGENGLGELGNGTTATTLAQTAGTWSKVSTGRRNTYGIRNDGTLWSWGHGNLGALGIGYTIMGWTTDNPPLPNGTDTGKFSPVQITGSWSQVYGLKDYALGIKTDGSLWAWGASVTYTTNFPSSPYFGRAVAYRSPVQITGSWNQIAAYSNSQSLMARKTDGTLWSWGNNEGGQLGIAGAYTVPYSSPVQVSVVNTAKIAMGTYHAGVINAGGAALMWGSNLEGQCADGGTSSLSIPTQVSGTTSWSQIACGGWFASGDQYYFSGFTLAITPNGSLYQWGNGSGATPTNIGGSTSFSQVAAGNSNFRGALQTDGTMLLWGANTNSRLGNGTTTDLASPTSILAGVQSFALGGFHGVAIKTDGTLVAWGNSDYGQCGSSGATGTPTATQSGSWSQIACGLYHTAGLRPDGTLWAWGANHFGQLGDNSTTAYRHSPVQIPGSYTAVAAGKYCTLAIKA